MCARVLKVGNTNAKRFLRSRTKKNWSSMTRPVEDVSYIDQSPLVEELTKSYCYLSAVLLSPAVWKGKEQNR